MLGRFGLSVENTMRFHHHILSDVTRAVQE
jgi:hypothetical protein